MRRGEAGMRRCGTKGLTLSMRRQQKGIFSCRRWQSVGELPMYGEFSGYPFTHLWRQPKKSSRWKTRQKSKSTEGEIKPQRSRCVDADTTELLPARPQWPLLSLRGYVGYILTIPRWIRWETLRGRGCHLPINRNSNCQDWSLNNDGKA